MKAPCEWKCSAFFVAVAKFRTHNRNYFQFHISLPHGAILKHDCCILWYVPNYETRLRLRCATGGPVAAGHRVRRGARGRPGDRRPDRLTPAVCMFFDASESKVRFENSGPFLGASVSQASQSLGDISRHVINSLIMTTRSKLRQSPFFCLFEKRFFSCSPGQSFSSSSHLYIFFPQPPLLFNPNLAICKMVRS